MFQASLSFRTVSFIYYFKLMSLIKIYARNSCSYYNIMNVVHKSHKIYKIVIFLRALVVHCCFGFIYNLIFLLIKIEFKIFKELKHIDKKMLETSFWFLRLFSCSFMLFNFQDALTFLAVSRLLSVFLYFIYACISKRLRPIRVVR